MKCYKQIISVFLAVAIAFACCLPAAVTPAHAAALDQFPSDTSITLNNSDVLRVPAEAISGNYIVYRVNNGAYRYYVIDVFESTDGVKELAFLTFDRYIAQSAITNADALNPNVWTKVTMKNVLYAISGALTVRPMYSTFDYYDVLGFLLIGGDGSETTEEDFSGTFEVNTPEHDFTLPREIMGEHFMIVNDLYSNSPDSMRVLVFPDLNKDFIKDGETHSYVSHFVSDKSISISCIYNSSPVVIEFPIIFDFSQFPYLYVTRRSSEELAFFASHKPGISDSRTILTAYSGNLYPGSFSPTASSPGIFYIGFYSLSSRTWSVEFASNTNGTFYEFGSLVWSNADIVNSSGTSYTWRASSSILSSSSSSWGSTAFTNQFMNFAASGVNILYSTFDYYAADDSLYFGNSFEGEVTEDDDLADLTLNDGTVIRVPKRFADPNSYFVVMDPVGGTEETAYLIYEFDYYEGVADGTVCDFTRWYGVATTTDDVTSWEWNYQEYYVTELDILDYGPIVYSTFEYVDGRTEDDESGDDSSGSAESKEFFAWFKDQWVKFTDKLYELLEDIRAKVGGGGLSISIENNTIIDEEDKEPFNPDVYKGVIKTLRNSVKLFSGFFGFIYDGVNNFIVYLTDTSSEFYGLFHLSELW